MPNVRDTGIIQLQDHESCIIHGRNPMKNNKVGDAANKAQSRPKERPSADKRNLESDDP